YCRTRIDLSCNQCFTLRWAARVVPGGLVILTTLRAAARTRLLGVHNANKATPAFARREDGLLLRLSSRSRLHVESHRVPFHRLAIVPRRGTGNPPGAPDNVRTSARQRKSSAEARLIGNFGQRRAFTGRGQPPFARSFLFDPQTM